MTKKEQRFAYTRKEMLAILIQDKGDCSRWIGCFDCPVSGTQSCGVYDSVYEETIKQYVARYGKKSLLEVLL